MINRFFLTVFLLVFLIIGISTVYAEELSLVQDNNVTSYNENYNQNIISSDNTSYENLNQNNRKGTFNINDILKDTPCPKYRVDLQNTAQYNEIGPTNNLTKFISSTPQSTCALVINDNKLILSDNVAINLTNGKYLGRVVNATPNYSDYTLYADNKIFQILNRWGVAAWDSEGNTKLWQTVFHGRSYDLSISPDGNVYYFGGNTVRALNGTNGSILWTFQTTKEIITSPATDNNGIMYFGCYKGPVYALSQSGELKWNLSFQGSMCYSPSIGPDGTIYFGYNNGYFYALNPNGTLKWNFTEDSYGIVSSPSIGKDGSIYFGSRNGKIYALNPNGTLKWNYTTGAKVESSAAISSNNIVYIGSSDKNMYAFNGSDGKLIWKYYTGIANLKTTPCIYNRTLYFYANNRVYAISDFAPCLSYNVSFDKNDYYIGENVYLNIDVNNEGNEDAKNLTFSFKLPDNLECTSENVTYDNNTNRLTYNFGNIELNSTVHYKIEFKAIKIGLFNFLQNSPKMEYDNGASLKINYTNTTFAINPISELFSRLSLNSSKIYVNDTFDLNIVVGNLRGCAVNSILEWKIPDNFRLIKYKEELNTAVVYDNSTKIIQWYLGDIFTRNYTLNITLKSLDISSTFVKPNITTSTLENIVGPDSVGNITIVTNKIEYPDLTIPSNFWALWHYGADVANGVSVPIKNIGEGIARNIEVSLYANDTGMGLLPVCTTIIPELAPGNQTTIVINDSKIRYYDKNVGEYQVKYEVKIDPRNLIKETNEFNNNKFAYPFTVVSSGYWSKSFHGGDNITTKHYYDLNGGLVYLPGRLGYVTRGWVDSHPNGINDYWNLSVPEGSEIVDVLLYMPHNWGTNQGYCFDVKFNNETITPIAMYRDTKGYGGWNLDFGLNVFNVTSLFKVGERNIFNVKLKEGCVEPALDPFSLYVIYKNLNQTRKIIYINEEIDLVLDGYEAGPPGRFDVFAPFNGTLDLNGIISARILASGTSAESNDSSTYFNNHYIGPFVNANVDIWQNPNVPWIIASNFAEFNVLDYLNSENNILKFAGPQSTLTYTHQILILEYNNPDLIINNISIDDNKLVLNKDNNISVLIKNDGYSDCGEFVLELKIGDTILTRTIDGLEKNSTKNIVFTFKPTILGNYEIIATIDKNNNINETNETNNILTKTFTCIEENTTPSEDKPDLTISNIYLTGNKLLLNKDNIITVLIENIGLADCSNFIVELKIGDTILTRTIDGLEKNSTKNIVFTFKPTILGNYEIIATIDKNNNINETNETNNILTKTFTCIEENTTPSEDKPDLTISNIYLTGNKLLLNKDNNINVLIENIGLADCGVFTLKLKVGDTILTKTISGLSKNSQKNVIFNFKPTEGKNYILTGTIDSNNDINELNELNNIFTCEFDALSTSYSLITENLIMYYGDGSEFSATILDSQNRPISNMIITMELNGVLYNKTTNRNGTAKLSINLDPGMYEITATNPNDNLIAKNTIAVLSTITGENIIKTFKNNTQYYAKFLDTNGNPLTEKTVQFNINGVFYNRTTDTNGIAKLNINLKPGTYIVTAINPINNELHSNFVEVLPSIEGKDIIKYFKNNTQYYAKFLNQEGKPLISQTVTFNIYGVFYNRTTDENGIAKLNINLNPGTYVITAINPLTKETHSNKIGVLSTLIENHDIEIYYKNGKYSIKLLDEQGNPFPNQKITFNIYGVFYNRTTDNNGIASLNINLNPGEYIITATHNGLSVSNRINVLSTVITNDLQMNYRDGSYFKAKILDGNGKLLSNVNVKYNIHGVFYDRPTDNNGISLLNVNLMPGEYIITTMYNGYCTSNKIKIF